MRSEATTPHSLAGRLRVVGLTPGLRWCRAARSDPDVIPLAAARSAGVVLAALTAELPRGPHALLARRTLGLIVVLLGRAFAHRLDRRDSRCFGSDARPLHDLAPRARVVMLVALTA
jgi:hypothetical protein